MRTDDYAKLVCAMVDIPVHNMANKKASIESLHVLFTLFSEFRQNQHFQNQDGNNTNAAAGAADLTTHF